jgi:hypothetical protein
LPYYFSNNYKFICEYLKGHVDHPSNGLFEKSEIRWFTVEELKRERNIFRDYFRNIIDIIIYNHPKTVSKMKGSGSYRVGKTMKSTRVKFSTSDLMKCDRMRKHKVRKTKRYNRKK